MHYHILRPVLVFLSQLLPLITFAWASPQLPAPVTIYMPLALVHTMLIFKTFHTVCSEKKGHHQVYDVPNFSSGANTGHSYYSCNL